MKLLLVLTLLFVLAVSQPNTKRQLYTNGLSPNFSLDQFITVPASFTKRNGGDQNGCRHSECTGGAATSFTVRFGDMDKDTIFCICNTNPVMSIDYAIERFRRIPWVAREKVKTLTMASEGVGGGAYNAGDHLAFFGRNQNTEVFLHEAAHSLDRNINRDAAWVNAVAQDSCVPDGYAQTNYVEDFAQVTVIWTYMVLSNRQNDAFFNCLRNQANVARDQRISVAQIMTLKQQPNNPPPPPAGNCNNYVGGTGSGLVGDYWNNGQFVGSRKDAVIAWDWGRGAPSMPGVGADNWSARWNGRVAVPFAGQWTFYTLSDDGASLWVNNIQLINQFHSQSATEHSGVITLAQNSPVPIKLEYFEGGADALLYLKYSHSCVAKTNIPAAQLFPPAGVASRDNGCDEMEGSGNGLFTSFLESESGPILNQGNYPVNFAKIPSVGDSNQTVGAIRAFGAIQARFGGDITFSAEISGKFRLFINNQTVIDSANGNSGVFKMEVGKFYSVLVEYVSADSFKAVLSWENAKCLPKEVIPFEYFFDHVPPPVTGSGEETDDVKVDSGNFLGFSAVILLIALLF